MSICRLTYLLGASCLILTAPAVAQIVPDTSVGTTVTPDVMVNGVQSDRIEGGTIRGANLFHSFSEFNVETGRGVYFTNPAGIAQIFTRITGTNPSQINGILGVVGGANLYFLNPNGIIFGANAKLDLNGSFLGTTANSIRFADGAEFNARNLSASPLLTISVPVGLQMGQNPASIQVNGTGHNITRTSFLAPLVRNQPNSGLRINPGNAIALIGGNIAFNGGVITAAGGSVELAAIGGDSASIAMNSTNTGWNFDYTGVQQFADIELRQRSLIDAGNTAPGSIRVRGSNLFLQGASAFLLENRGTQPMGGIDIKTTQSVQLTGDSPSNQLFSSGILSDTFSTGRGGNITIFTNLLLVEGNSNLIRALTFGAANSGNIQIDAADIRAIGGLKDSSVVIIRTFGSGNGGNLTLNTERLLVQNGGTIGNNVNGGSGSAGNLTVNATESVEVGGSGGLTNSLIGSSAVSPSGSSGTITVNTPRLIVSDGAVISSSTYGSGTAGSITINASESIEVRGRGFNASTQQRQSSAIQSAGILTPPATQRFFGLSNTVTGSAGNITLNTPDLQITDGGTITVRHNHLGDAGKLNINGDRILLDRQGSITASTQSGQGGNINIQLRDRLLLRNNSEIDVESFGTGNGGNITIKSPTIVGLENSDIIANAVQGNGGNIQITAQGIFGLENRPRLTPESDITASSQFGISGTVNVSILNINQHNVVQPSPDNFVNSDQLVASSCLAPIGNSQGSFLVTGNGGLPETPSTAILPYEVVQVQAIETPQALLSNQESKAAIPVTTSTWKIGDPIVEATEFSVNAQGQVVLTAKANSAAAANAQPHPIPCQPN